MPNEYAADICQKATELFSGERAKTYGPVRENHKNIASLWGAYLGDKPGCVMDEHDVLIMLALMKIARTKSGSGTADSYVDGVAYIALAGEVRAGADHD